MANDYKPANTPALIPYLAVQNMQKSIDFYEKAFGFKIYGEVAKDNNGNIIHLEMRHGEASIMFSPEGAFNMVAKAPITNGVESGIGLYVYCKDVDSLYAQAIKNGAKSLTAPENMFWNDRMCRLMDSNHYNWSFATKINK